MQASTRLREAIHHTLQQTENDLEAQRIATEYAFRRRIHEFERAKDELEWQKKNVSYIHVEWKFVVNPSRNIVVTGINNWNDCPVLNLEIYHWQLFII